MQQNDIIKIRIDITSENQHALSLMLAKDGSIIRQGTANIPIEEAIFEGVIDKDIFETLVARLEAQLFDYAQVYDHPDKTGVPIIYSVAFQNEQEESKFFEFRFASGTADLGDLLPFFDDFISQAVSLTDDWYLLQLNKNKSH